MLEIINRYAHGFVAIPVILACKEKGFFQLLQEKGLLNLEQMVEHLGANSGHFLVALRMMESLNWLSQNDSGEYSLTDNAKDHQLIPEKILDLYHLPIDSLLLGEQSAEPLKIWIKQSCQSWNIDNSLIADFLDGILIIPILLALHKNNLITTSETTPLFSKLCLPAREALYRLFESKEWVCQKESQLVLTEAGKFVVNRALITGVTASYTPLLSRIIDLLFGDCQAVFSRDVVGSESHVNRTLNVIASGFQHEKYFADLDEIILSIFNRLPLEEQPKYVADMGCGDGTLLKRVYATIKHKSMRGKVLKQYPIKLIGIDYNEESLTVTAQNLAEMPHLVLKGDIGDPEQMVRDLQMQGIHDPENILHIRSFLDHDRPFISPMQIDKAQARARLSYGGVYVNGRGQVIPSHVMVQSLVEHLEQWATVTSKHGLIILEVHCLEPKIINQYLDRCENLHFDACQGFSMQHLMEAEVFLTAAAEVGLFPTWGFSKRYPRTLPFSRITLNCFEKRPYRIRHPQFSDLPALINLETKCWPEHLQVQADDIVQRIERCPRGQCVLEIDGQIVGVIYSQRIASISDLEKTPFVQVPSLHTQQGSVIQLLAVNVLPEMQHLGLGDQLLEFMLQYCSLQSGIERAVGVTRCRNYVDYAPMPLEDYIRHRNEQGQIIDPVLRFHESHGAIIRGLIPGYRPEDIANQGSGILIEYDLRNRQPQEPGLTYQQKEPIQAQKHNKPKEDESLEKIVEECIRSLLSKHRQAAFAPKRPLLEMGIDSLELMELRMLLNKRFGVELDPTFFFRYGTPDAITRYFQSQRSVPVTVSSESLHTLVQDRQKIANEDESGFSQRATNFEDGVAIIGLSCRFPGGVNNPEEYWTLMQEGIDAITEVPINRWSVEGYYDSDQKQPGKISTKYGGFLDKFDQFDAEFFHISPREAIYIDPQQRILLEETWNALENAGLAPDKLEGTQTGVFVGIFSHDYELLQVKHNKQKDFNTYFGTGNSAAVAAGRLSYVFGFHGPALAVNTACSSSLVAVHLACQALRNGECDIALAAGVNLLLSPELSIAFSQAGMLSADGRCKTFDASANGYVRSEGCGVIVLKRLSQAIADNDNIQAVVRGTAINQDGASNGLTAPNGLAQEAVIRKALSVANVSPHEVSFVEAHGTGTPLGDPVEFKALEAVYGQDREPDNPLVISSVKTNIGHTEAAAGIAGLIKVVLSMQNRYIPPHLHFEELNPHIILDRIPAVIPKEGMDWKGNSSSKRLLAGVSSFGFSGTNAHIILEEAPVLVRKGVKPHRCQHLLTLSARSQKALTELAQTYEKFLASHPETALADVCFTANTGRSHFNYRLAIISNSTAHLHKQLKAFSAGQETAGLVSGQIHSCSPKIAFLFTGQGSQYVSMGRQLYETQPTFRTTLNRCDEILHPYLGYSLLKVLYPEPGAASLIDETAFTQPALFAIEYSLTELWRSWGIEPNVVMGHSVGEYVAACVAGLCSLEDGLKLIATRAKLMQALPPGGAMVAVFASQEVVAAALKPFAGKVAIAAVNGPQNIVISGEGEAIRHIVATLEVAEIKTVQLKVSHAFHSPLMEPMLTEFKQVASEVTFFSPKLDLISNVTGELATGDIATPEYWCRHVMQPVQFAASIKRLHRTGYDIFIECGPKPILLGMGRQCLPEGVGVWLPSLHPRQEDGLRMLESLGELYVRGVSIDGHGLDQGYPRRKLALPTYPFQQERYWLTLDQIQVTTADRSDNGISTNGIHSNGIQTNNVYTNGTQINGGQVNGLQKEVNQNQTFQKAEVLLRQTAALLPQLIELVLAGRQQTSPERPEYNATYYGDGETHSEQQGQLLVQQLERIPANERLNALINHLQQEIASVLRFGSSELPDPKIGFFKMGMDSILAVELQKRLEASLGCLISSTTVFNYPNIQSLAKYLLQDVLGLTTTENQMLDKDELVQVVFEVEHLSEAEVEALLIQKLANL